MIDSFDVKSGRGFRITASHKISFRAEGSGRKAGIA